MSNGNYVWTLFNLQDYYSFPLTGPYGCCVNTSGKIIYIMDYGGSLLIMKNSGSIREPIFTYSNSHLSPSFSSRSNSQQMCCDSLGQNLYIIIENRIYISNDEGLTFSGITEFVSTVPDYHVYRTTYVCCSGSGKYVYVLVGISNTENTMSGIQIFKNDNYGIGLWDVIYTNVKYFITDYSTFIGCSSDINDLNSTFYYTIPNQDGISTSIYQIVNGMSNIFMKLANISMKLPNISLKGGLTTFYVDSSAKYVTFINNSDIISSINYCSSVNSLVSLNTQIMNINNTNSSYGNYIVVGGTKQMNPTYNNPVPTTVPSIYTSINGSSTTPTYVIESFFDNPSVFTTYLNLIKTNGCDNVNYPMCVIANRNPTFNALLVYGYGLYAAN